MGSIPQGGANLVKQEFGGEWTTEKLGCLRKYLESYSRIFDRNIKAKYFRTTYLDAFAGTGYRSKSLDIQPESLPLIDDTSEEGVEALSYLKGSTQIALEVVPGFSKYIFVDKNPDYINELEKLKVQFPDKVDKILIKQGEANTFLKEWCQTTDWYKNRAVVFLDPYGTQIDWSTIELIGKKTYGVDLWILFPLGVGVNRLLNNDHRPTAGRAKALTRIFGTESWQSTFYKTEVKQTLWGEEFSDCKQTDFENIGNFFVNRLKSVFPAGAVLEEPLPLCNSKNNPIYLFCFASSNPKVGKTAMKIASSIVKNTRKRK
jgi:three-Cys-motif partner protein